MFFWPRRSRTTSKVASWRLWYKLYTASWPNLKFWGVNKAFPWEAHKVKFLLYKMAFLQRRNSTNSENDRTTHVLVQITAKPLWCVKKYQYVCAALPALVLLHSRNIRDCLRLILVSESRIAVKVFCHTFSMTLCWDLMKDIPCLWFFELRRECGVILDRSRCSRVV